MEGNLDFPHQPVAKEDILRDDRKFLVFFLINFTLMEGGLFQLLTVAHLPL